MLIRAGVPSDIPQMMALAAESETAAHWSVQEYEALFAAAAPIRVAIIAIDEATGDEVVGFVIARCSADEWEIENVVVARELQRQGIATGLLNALVSSASQADARSVLLEVRASNAAARALYAKKDFREEGRRRGYYQNPEEDGILLRLQL